KPSGINQTLYPSLMKQSPERLYGHFMDAFWFDTGDMYFLWLASMRLLERLHQRKHEYTAAVLEEFGGYREAQPGVWIHGSADVPSHCNISAPVVIGRAC